MVVEALNNHLMALKWVPGVTQSPIQNERVWMNMNLGLMNNAFFCTLFQFFTDILLAMVLCRFMVADIQWSVMPRHQIDVMMQSVRHSPIGLDVFFH